MHVKDKKRVRTAFSLARDGPSGCSSSVNLGRSPAALEAVSLSEEEGEGEEEEAGGWRGAAVRRRIVAEIDLIPDLVSRV